MNLKNKSFYFYFKFLGCFTKKGNKNKAKKLLDRAFLLLSKKTGFSTNKILFYLFLKLNVFIEIKKVRVKRNFHLVPFPIKFKRRIYLVLKWVYSSILEDRRKISLADKIYLELFKIMMNLPSKSLKQKNNNLSQAFFNRSNSHYRW